MKNLFYHFLFQVTCMLFVVNFSYSQFIKGTIDSVKITQKANEMSYIKIYLPDEYKKSSGKKFPVMYLLDDQKSNFYFVAAQIEQLVGVQHAHPMILVFITPEILNHYPTNPFEETNGKSEGEIAKEILSNSVIPAVEKKYASAPFRILAGQRNHALMALFILFHAPEVFKANIIISPTTYHVVNFEVPFRKFLVANPHLDNFIYISIGFGDDPGMRETLEFARLLNSHSIERPLSYHFEYLQNETNATLLQQSINNAMKILFENSRFKIMLPYGGVETLISWKKENEKRFNYDLMEIDIPKISVAQPLKNHQESGVNSLIDVYNYLYLTRRDELNFNRQELENLSAYYEANNQKAYKKHVSDLLKKLKTEKKEVTFKNNYNEKSNLQYALVHHIKMNANELNTTPYLQNYGAVLVEDRHENADNAWYFGGKQHVELHDEAIYQGSLSISFWVKPDEQERFRPIIAKIKSNKTKPEWRIGFGPIADYQWGVTLWHHAFKDYLCNDQLPAGEWSHLTIILDQTLGVASMYRNGLKTGEQPFLIPFSGSSEKILIGKSINGTQSSYFKGSIDDLRIYHRVLSKMEVKDLFQLR